MRISLLGFVLAASLLAFFCGSPACAQVQTGTPPFGSFAGSPDVLDLANLNAHITIPVVKKAGRGVAFTYNLSYDSSVWYPSSSSGSATWTPVYNWGWRGETEASTGYISDSSTSTVCSYIKEGNLEIPNGWNFIQDNFVYHDPWGVPHPFAGFASYKSATCGGGSTQINAVATDGSGYTINGGWGATTITSKTGAVFNVPYGTGSGSATSTDRNGNEITVSSSGVFTDTLGTNALTVSGVAPANVTFAYPAPSGTNAYYTIKYQNYTVETNFGCSGIVEYPATTVALVSEIDLPDIGVNPDDKYTFTYETTPADTHSPHYVTSRLATVTLPAGGTISYDYVGGSNGITCSDGSTAGLQRYTPDTGSSFWSYQRTAGTGAAYTTTITDPFGDKTVVQFQGIYETQRAVYQNASTLLETINTCYNGNTSNCTSSPITPPIVQRNVTTILQSGQQSEHDDYWNSYGAPIQTSDYDYGTAPHGALLKSVAITYATLGTIHAFYQNVTTKNGSGAIVSEMNYNYDETTPTTTSGTPQHVSVGPPWGNLTSTNTYTKTGTYLTASTSYYDTGNPFVNTDINGGTTTYSYASGSASCYNSFPTSVIEAVSTLSRSMTWNCAGGVELISTDENSQPTTTVYSDAYFWRPASTTDPSGATTNYCYGLLTGGSCTTNTTQTESTMVFGGSIVDILSTTDSLGRAHIQQTRQGPSSSVFDSVETDYDALGRVSRATLAYSGSEGQTYSGSAATIYTFDAMNRMLSAEDGNGGTVSYSYGPSNDVLVVSSPASSGENTKKRQFEYDALSRLTSVCEITAGAAPWVGGTCSQKTPQTGYWTIYSYDPLGNLLNLTQNAQMAGSTQSRSFSYDWASRLSSETAPEFGTTGNGSVSYTYDSDSTCGTSGGDVVKKIDAAGDVICMSYDPLHRVTAVTYPSGVYSSVTPQKHFVFDAATVNGQTMSNAKARLAEGYTCFSPCTTKTADLGLSYSSRGEVTDVYESTPHSGGFYYHTSQTYWANGSPYQLTGNIGLPSTITYGLDGEGRLNTVSASTGENPVTGSSYTPAGLLTQLNYGSGSGDSDAYTWDPNTNRMKKYVFTVNGSSYTGQLNWNLNGTTQTQAITDGFNALGTQNCSYGYDDLTRLVTANCGTAASQTFTYDPFGNIDKSGSPYSFQPTYSTSSNHISELGGFAVTYDGNGNMTDDNVHSYAWDADGHAISVDAGESDGVTLVYDARGRMVEQNRSGVYREIVYSTTGQKLALMNGETLTKAMVPLAGKAFAVYSSGGLQYYAHPDLLGSIRLATTPGRTLYFDTAYAPFGETYASSGTLDPAYTGKMNDTSHRQDTVSGLYDFPAREFSTQGRWPNPDPLGKMATCSKDPQSQNRYAYVRNNPITYTDPTGMIKCDPNTDPWCIPCQPGDPDCGDCPPESPSCGWCDPTFDPDCGQPGGGGSGGGGGGGKRKPEQPRTFPWVTLPLGFFGSPEAAGTPGPDLYDCVLMQPIPPILLPIQGFGCVYLCGGPGGIAAPITAPRNSWNCFFQPCPLMAQWKRVAGPVGVLINPWPNKFCKDSP